MKRTTLTRADIAETLVKEVDVPRQQASAFLEVVLNNMIESLVTKGSVKISSFGSFNVRRKARRIGRNPKTGEEAIIAPRRVVAFKPSQYMKEKVQRRKE